MSDKISAVTETLTLVDEDLFALAKNTAPSTYVSRHVSVGTLIDQLVSSETFLDALTTSTDFINQLVQNSEFITALTTNVNFDNSLAITLRTIVEEETGTTYTLVLDDADHKWKQFTNASPITVTVPPDADVDWPDNTYIELAQGGNGAVTIAEGIGVTINFNENLTNVLNGDFAVAALKKVGANEWNLFGNLVPA